METVHEAPRARIQPLPTAVAPDLHLITTPATSATTRNTVGSVPALGMLQAGRRPSTSHGQRCNTTSRNRCSEPSPAKLRRQRCRPVTTIDTQAQQVPQPSTSTEHSAFLRAWDQRIRSSMHRPASAPSSSQSSPLWHHHCIIQHRISSKDVRWLLHPDGLSSTSSRVQEQLMQRVAGLTTHVYHTSLDASQQEFTARPRTPIALRGLTSASLAGSVAVQAVQQQQVWQQLASGLSQPQQRDWRPATAGARAHGSTSQVSIQGAGHVQGASSAAATLNGRMFARWQAVRAAQQSSAAALVNEGVWATDALQLNSEERVLPADSPVMHGSRQTPAAGEVEGLALAHASQLLDRCTVLSSKKHAESCCICLDEVAVNALVPLLYCGHRMHRGCLLRWLSQHLTEQPALQLEQAVVCPMCKQVSVDRRLLCSVEPG